MDLFIYSNVQLFSINESFLSIYLILLGMLVIQNVNNFLIIDENVFGQIYLFLDVNYGYFEM